MQVNRRNLHKPRDYRDISCLNTPMLNAVASLNTGCLGRLPYFDHRLRARLAC